LKAFFVPRAGLEPARFAPLVFETNASTNSATWAFFELQKYKFNTIHPPIN
jgi:hypothetical protein